MNFAYETDKVLSNDPLYDMLCSPMKGTVEITNSQDTSITLHKLKKPRIQMDHKGRIKVNFMNPIWINDHYTQQ